MESAGRVLIIVQNLPVPFDRRVWLEAKALTEAGFNVSVVSPTGTRGRYQAPYEYLDNIHIFRYPAPPTAHGVLGYIFEFFYCFLMTAVLSLRIWLRYGFDIIHACNPPETYFLLGLAYRPFGVRFVFDHHDLSPEMYVAKRGRAGDLFYRGLRWLEKLTMRTADVVITTNQSHMKIATGRGGVKSENVFVVRSGPDFERLTIRQPEIDLKDGFRYLVCYLGEMCEQDGVDRLLFAIQFVVTELKRHDIKFVLLGGGPELEHLVGLKNRLDMGRFVHFAGRVPDDVLCRYLSTADLCVDPDPLTEWSDKSTMNKIMEYMAFAKPIVAFDLTENRYSAQEAAIYATPNSVQELGVMIASLLDNESARSRMGEFGRRRVEEHLSWEHSKPSLLAAYRRLMSGK